jgi:hypothetical protein
LTATAAVTTAVAIGYGTVPAAAATGALSAEQSAMVLRIAAAGAVYPIPFPSFGESGSALSRATPVRLHNALDKVGSTRLALIRAGADALVRANPADDAALRAAVADLSGTDRVTALTAAVAVAVATISTHFDPNADAAAQLWIGGLRRLPSGPDTEPSPAGRTR